MTKKIKILRQADLRIHANPGKPNLGTSVFLREDSPDIELTELPKKHGEHTVYEVHLKEGLVYLVEGLDFKFI